MTLRIGIEMV